MWHDCFRNSVWLRCCLFCSHISCFQRSLSAALLQSQSAANTCFSVIIWEVCCIEWLHFHMAIMDTEDIFRHSCAARQKLFVIKRWSPRRKEGEANQNSSSSQSFQPSLRADIDRQWCVCQFDQSSVSRGQTGRHPRWEEGGWGESLGWGVEDGRGV